MNKFFYPFNDYLQSTFGQKVYKVSVDAGFSCPNLDGKLSDAGCVFCNNKAFSFFTKNKDFSLEEQIAQGIDYARRRFKAKKYIIYYQSFSNTYGDLDFLKKQYSVIKKFNDVVGLAISTRPDCIDEAKLDLIESFSRDYKVYIEYGLQSVYDKTLNCLNRNHSFVDFSKAIELTANRNINIGVHIILGLPNENKEACLKEARILSKLPIWGIKFHCLHVVKDTSLERIYQKGEFKPISEDEYVDRLVSFLEILPRNWVVLRLVSDAQKGLLICPDWVNRKQEVIKKIEAEFARRKTYQGFFHEGIDRKNS